MTEPQRPDKILIAMYELSGGSKKSLKYEDIVVKAFEMFREEFSLRGYPQYPDASDIHKPLYGPLKRSGFVRSANKAFALTDQGIARAAQLGGRRGEGAERLDRAVEAELKRIVETDAFKLYVSGQAERILDTDFYGYLGTTVRTPRNDFLQQLTVVGEAVDRGSILVKDPRYPKANDLHDFLIIKFNEIIKRKRGEK
jgi:hypothetical protein